jgi:hypothetical protein
VTDGIDGVNARQTWFSRVCLITYKKVAIRKGRTMQLTIEVTRDDLAWLRQHIKVRAFMVSTNFDSASISDKILGAIYEAARTTMQPCGHPASSIVGTAEGTSCCEDCVREVEKGWVGIE